jgi:hypothetical protein
MVNSDWWRECDKCWVRFVIGWWIQTGRVCGNVVGWGLWLNGEFRPKDWLEEMWGDVCDWMFNSGWRSEWDSCGVRFVIGWWIQTEEMSGTAVGWGLWLDSVFRPKEWVEMLWVVVWVLIVNSDWKSYWYSCGLGLWMGGEFRLYELVGQL